MSQFRRHFEAGDTRAPLAPCLLFVAGHRHYGDFALQGAVLSLQRHRHLVRSCDLLIHSNNPEHRVIELHKWASLYPHARKTIVFDPQFNSGKRCGHLQAFAVEHALWQDRELAIFTHPDVYMLPRALSTFEALLQQWPRATFFVSTLRPPYIQAHAQLHNSTRLYVTDLLVVRPRRLRAGLGPSPDGAARFFDSMCLSRTNATDEYPGTRPLDVSPERGLFRAVHVHGLREPGVQVRVPEGQARAATSPGLVPAPVLAPAPVSGRARGRPRVGAGAASSVQWQVCVVYDRRMFERGVDEAGVWHAHQNQWVLRLVRTWIASGLSSDYESYEVNGGNDEQGERQAAALRLLSVALERTLNETRPPADRATQTRPAGALLHASLNAIDANEWRRFVAKNGHAYQSIWGAGAGDVAAAGMAMARGARCSAPPPR
jgi:hypothetical protein